MQPIAAPLLQWFQANKRLLPFRQEPSAYHIWVSEIMLQQTRVAAAIPYYNRFIAALPTPADLAVCEPDALRKLWQGLGYYNRVNNMQKFRGSVPIRPEPSLPLPMGFPCPPWTATCCGCLPGCTTMTPT